MGNLDHLWRPTLVRVLLGHRIAFSWYIYSKVDSVDVLWMAVLSTPNMI